MVDHTGLPQELWLEIFRWATYVPHARRLEPMDAFEPRHAMNWACGINTPVSSMHVKRILVLVCRAWYTIAIELLYEHVTISSTRTALLLLRALQASEERTVGGQHTYCSSHAQWIRHVGVHTLTRSSAKLDFWYTLAHILRRCLNAQLVSVIIHYPAPRFVLDRIFKQVFQNTLQGLSWEQQGLTEDDAFGADGFLSASFLQMFECLRVLDLSKLIVSFSRRQPGESVLASERGTTRTRVNGDLGNKANPSACVSLPSLAVLAIPASTSILNFASTLDLPSLERLLVHAASPEPELSIALESFLRKHGPSVTTLEVCSGSPDKTKQAVNVTDFLQPGLCPNLDTVVYDARETGIAFDPAIAPSKYTPNNGSPTGVSTSSLSHPSTPDRQNRTNRQSPFKSFLSVPHPTVRRIALRSFPLAHLYPPSRCPHANHSHPAHTRSHGHLWSLFSALSHEPNLLPGLETIRLTDTLQEACMDCRVGRQLLAWWVDQMENVGVDLQDGEGIVWMYEDEKAESDSELKEDGESRDGDCPNEMSPAATNVE